MKVELNSTSITSAVMPPYRHPFMKYGIGPPDVAHFYDEIVPTIFQQRRAGLEVKRCEAAFVIS